MKTWLALDQALGARIDALVPEFVTTGYAESLDEQRMKTCAVPACFRLWAFPPGMGRLTPGRRHQVLPVRLTLGFIFDSKRSLAGEETAHGALGSLTLVPRAVQAVVSWDPKPHCRAPFEFISADSSREGTRTFWEVELTTSIDEPFV